MKHPSQYPAKLLLFGEYTIIQDSKALAIPLYNFGGYWKMAESGNINIELQQGLPAILKYVQLAQQNKTLLDIDTTAFEKDLQKGLFFYSNIPQGYGLGSSGAVTAAIYDRFAQGARQTDDLLKLKRTLAQLESCFHGASSGSDPLICYLDQAVLFRNKEELEKVQINKAHQESLFLIDTGVARKTSPLVQIYLEKCKDDYYQNRLHAELIPLIDDGINAFLENQLEQLIQIIHQISYFQFKYFDPMIPDTYRSIWLDCLSSSHTKLKLCGAGGGGCILGFTSDKEQAKTLLKDQNLIFINEPNR